jgi:hypothetical protein
LDEHQLRMITKSRHIGEMATQVATNNHNMLASVDKVQVMSCPTDLSCKLKVIEAHVSSAVISSSHTIRSKNWFQAMVVIYLGQRNGCWTISRLQR